MSTYEDVRRPYITITNETVESNRLRQNSYVSMLPECSIFDADAYGKTETVRRGTYMRNFFFSAVNVVNRLTIYVRLVRAYGLVEKR